MALLRLTWRWAVETSASSGRVGTTSTSAGISRSISSMVRTPTCAQTYSSLPKGPGGGGERSHLRRQAAQGELQPSERQGHLQRRSYIVAHKKSSHFPFKSPPARWHHSACCGTT